MKLSYIVLVLFVILQLTKGGKVPKQVVTLPPETTTENVEDFTTLLDIVPDDIQVETGNVVGDHLTATDILDEKNLNELATEDPNLEEGTSVAPQNLLTDEEINSLMEYYVPVGENDTRIPDLVPEGEVSSNITREDEQSNSTPDLGLVEESTIYYMAFRGANTQSIQDDVVNVIPDVLPSDGSITTTPDLGLVNETSTFYVKRGGETPGEETYIPVQDLVKGDLNFGPEVIPDNGNSTPIPKEIYYVRQEGTNPGEYIYIPTQDFLGEEKITLDKDINGETPTLGADILNNTNTFFRPYRIPIPVLGDPVLPIPYYMSYIRRDNNNGSVVLDDSEDIPTSISYGSVYTERLVSDGQEDNIPINDTVVLPESEKNPDNDGVPIERPAIYVDGALRATGGGFKEEPNPGDIRLFVKQNEYPELHPSISVAPHTFPNLTNPESANVAAANAGIPSKTFYSNTITSPLKPVTANIPNKDKSISSEEMKTTSITITKPSGQTSPQNVSVKPTATTPVKTSTIVALPATKVNPNYKTVPSKQVPTPSPLPVKNNSTVTSVPTKPTTVTKAPLKKQQDDVKASTKKTTPAPKIKSPDKVKTPAKQAPVAKATPTKSPATVKTSTKAPPKQPVIAVKSAAKASSTQPQVTTVKTSVKGTVTTTTIKPPTTTAKPPLVKKTTPEKPPTNTNIAAKTAPTTKAPPVKPPVNANNSVKTAPTTKAPAVKSAVTPQIKTKNTTTAPAVKSAPKKKT